MQKINKSKIISLCVLLIAFAILVGSVFFLKVKENQMPQFISGARVINSDNRKLIGTEIKGITPIIASSDEQKTKLDLEVADKIPDNNIIKEVDNDEIVLPVSITNFKAVDGKTPEVIMTNGSLVLFVNGDKGGWTCKPGDKLMYKFEKYATNITKSQSMVVGYILDGVLYQGNVMNDLSGTYQLDIAEAGEYYIYIISATSDYLALKQGEISISR